MRPLQLKKTILSAIDAQIALFIWGPPGVGKSKLTLQTTEEIDYGLIDLRLSQLDPADIRGIPSIDHEKHLSIWNAPEFLPRVEEHGEKGVLFFDELPNAHPATQTVAYQLILDRKVGNYVLPDGWTVLAAGNRMEDKSHTHRMSSALSSRFLHVDFEVFYEDWIAWAGPAGIIPEIISFIRWRPSLLHKMDPDARSYPCPRTWEFGSVMLPRIEPDIEFDVMAGLVGEGAATEFIAYNKIFRKLPDPDEILKNPDKVKVNLDDPAVMFAITGSLAHRADKTNFEKILKYGDRMPPEYQTILIRDSLAKTNDLRHEACFKKWIRKNSSVLL